ncbi:MAG TPA: MoaD/ThiS family protein [Planctomycetaceae bacterium]|nr:MoaD/ThiS family protein [Planctomycetaceae bacterium]
MAQVHLPSALRDLTDGTAVVVAGGATVREVVENLERQFPGIKGRLCRGAVLRPGLMAVVGSKMSAGLNEPVGPDDEVHFLPALGGG